MAFAVFVSVSAATGTIFCWAYGNFVLFGFRLFEKQFFGLVALKLALTILFCVGLAQFFVGVGLLRRPVELSQFLWTRW